MMSFLTPKMGLTLNPIYFNDISGSIWIARKHSMVELSNLIGALL